MIPRPGMLGDVVHCRAKNTAVRARARECVKGRRRASLSLPRVEDLARRFSPTFAKSPPAKNHPPWVWAYVWPCAWECVKGPRRASLSLPPLQGLARRFFPPGRLQRRAPLAAKSISPTHPPLSFTRTFRRHRSSGVDPPPPPASGSPSCSLPNWKGRGNAALP